MNGARRIFIPVFGIGAVLSLAAISTWLSGGRHASDGIALGGAFVLVWIVVVLVWRKRR